MGRKPDNLHAAKENFYLLGIFLVFLISLYFALAGVDFGTQWDQNNIKGHVNRFIRTGNILPGEYHYPPGSSYIATTTVIPYALPFVARYGLNWVPTQQYLLDEVLKNANQTFLLNLRRVFVFFSIFGVVWTGLAAAQRDRLAALVAAAALAFSWEVNYQSRFVHPDGPTMQFVALTLLFCMLGYYKKRPLRYQWWFGLAAVTSAMATATKYTAGVSIFIVLVLYFVTLKNEKSSGRTIAFRLVFLLFAFVTAFLILVPGVILESSIFIHQVVRDQQIYAGGYGYQTVDAGWDYFQRIFVYIFQAAFSHNRILALFIPTLALVGIYSLVAPSKHKERGLALALAGIPLLYILFLATHRALFVRNLLLIFPNLAILAGFGFSWLWRRLRPYAAARSVLGAIFLILLVANALWINYSVESIRLRNTDVFVEQALLAVAERSDQSVYITPTALRLLGDRALPSNSTTQFSGSEDLVLYAYRGDTFDEEEGSWPVNFPAASPLTFGPLEINMDWYANWPGVERLVLAVRELAWQDGANLSEAAPIPFDAAVPTQSISGTLMLDGEQFIVEVDETQRIFLLNSANPNAILALRPLLESQISISGKPHDSTRPLHWYLLSVNGKHVLQADQLTDEYNFSRFFSNLTENEKTCTEQAIGSAQFWAVRDTATSLVDLSDEELHKVAACLGE